MRYWSLFVLLCGTFTAIPADNPLNFNKHPLNKTPTGFRAAGGDSNEWKVVEAKIPSTLDPSATVKRQCLRHSGGTNDSTRYPSLMNLGRDYKNLVLKTSFRIDGGKGVQAAGVFFRAQKDNSYILFAIIPSKKRMYLTYCEKGVPVGGQNSEIKLPENGWFHLELTCQNDQISGRLNGGAFPAITLNDMPPGKVGFWARGDTDCLFAMSSVSLPVRFSQSVVNEIARTNKHLQRVELVAIRTGKKIPEIAAATDPKKNGQPAHSNCLDTIKNGAVIYSKGRNAIEVIMPVKNVDGEIMAAARMFLKPGKLTTKTKHQARASAVAIELGNRIQTHAKLFR